MTNTGKNKFSTIADDEDFRNGYASRTTWAEILEPHGWVRLGSDTGDERWEPPGRSGRQTSGAARAGLSLIVFTTSTEFEVRKQYSKFEAYAVLNHGDDRRAAAEALLSQGFVVFRERDSDGNQIVRCGGYSYAWPVGRDPLKVGDTVELPPPVNTYARETYGDQPRQATVTHLGSYYSGPFVQVARLVKRALPYGPKTRTTQMSHSRRPTVHYGRQAGRKVWEGIPPSLVPAHPVRGRLTGCLIPLA